MIRHLFTGSALLSLLLCVGTCITWVRGYKVGDDFMVGYWGFHPHPLSASHVAGRGMQIGSYPGGWCIDCMWDICVGSGNEYRTAPYESIHHVRYEQGDVGHSPRRTLLGFKHKAGDAGYRHDIFWVPDYALALGSLVLPIGWGTRRVRRKALQTAGLCAGCGYDLRASTNRCPECGIVIPSTGG